MIWHIGATYQSTDQSDLPFDLNSAHYMWPHPQTLTSESLYLLYMPFKFHLNSYKHLLVMTVCVENALPK